MDYKVKDCVLQSIYSDAYEIANAEIPWDKLVGSTVLITGGGGFIGGYLSLALLARNDEYNSDIRVIALVRNGERARKKFGDLLERDDFSLCVQDVNEEITVNYSLKRDVQLNEAIKYLSDMNLFKKAMAPEKKAAKKQDPKAKKNDKKK